MPRNRERIFNLPGVVLAAVALLLAIQVLLSLLPIETSLGILSEFAFVPGRFTYAFDPRPVVGALDALRHKSELDAYVAAHYFLGNGAPRWWTPLTYAFLHASFLHVGFNCLWLVAFGAAVARRFGTLRFLLFSAVTALAGAAAHYLTHPYDLQPVIGASAVVSGTMAAAIRFVFQPGAPLGETLGYRDPRADHAYRMPALPLRAVLTDRRAVVFLVAWLLANLLFGMAPQLSGLAAGETIAWQAHIGGFVVGLFGFRFFDPPPERRDAASSLDASQEDG